MARDMDTKGTPGYWQMFIYNLTMVKKTVGRSVSCGKRNGDIFNVIYSPFVLDLEKASSLEAPR